MMEVRDLPPQTASSLMIFHHTDRANYAMTISAEFSFPKEVQKFCISQEDFCSILHSLTQNNFRRGTNLRNCSPKLESSRHLKKKGKKNREDFFLKIRVRSRRGFACTYR